VTGFSLFVGSDYNDTIFGKDMVWGDGRTDFSGCAGDDLIRAAPRVGGSISGGEGNDRLYGDAGTDFFSPGTGDDYIDGGLGGDDSVGFESGPVWASLSVGRAEGEGNDTLIGVESLIGSPYDDTLIGDAGPNRLSGGGGRDLLYGRRAPDYLTSVGCRQPHRVVAEVGR
jgi:Ca2+-binding RTX toxin-like protein